MNSFSFTQLMKPITLSMAVFFSLQVQVANAQNAAASYPDKTVKVIVPRHQAQVQILLVVLHLRLSLKCGNSL